MPREQNTIIYSHCQPAMQLDLGHLSGPSPAIPKPSFGKPSRWVWPASASPFFLTQNIPNLYVYISTVANIHIRHRSHIGLLFSVHETVVSQYARKTLWRPQLDTTPHLGHRRTGVIVGPVPGTRWPFLLRFHLPILEAQNHKIFISTVNLQDIINSIYIYIYIYNSYIYIYSSYIYICDYVCVCRWSDPFAYMELTKALYIRVWVPCKITLCGQPA